MPVRALKSSEGDHVDLSTVQQTLAVTGSFVADKLNCRGEMRREMPGTSIEDRLWVLECRRLDCHFAFKTLESCNTGYRRTPRPFRNPRWLDIQRKSTVLTNGLVSHKDISPLVWLRLAQRSTRRKGALCVQRGLNVSRNDIVMATTGCHAPDPMYKQPPWELASVGFP